MRRLLILRFVLLVVGVVLLASITAFTITPRKWDQQPTMDWENVCKGLDSLKVSYCNNVGKDAYNATGPAVLRDVKLGKIIGVCWRPKGSIIGYSPAIPEADIPAEIRRSPRDAYYYIIDDGTVDADGKMKPFIRQCREIQAKNHKKPQGS